MVFPYVKVEGGSTLQMEFPQKKPFNFMQNDENLGQSRRTRVAYSRELLYYLSNFFREYFCYLENRQKISRKSLNYGLLIVILLHCYVGI